MTPILGPWYDVAWSALALAQVALLVGALARWSRMRASRGGGLLDLLMIVLLPIVGPAAYLVGTRKVVGER